MTSSVRRRVSSFLLKRMNRPQRTHRGDVPVPRALLAIAGVMLTALAAAPAARADAFVRASPLNDPRQPSTSVRLADGRVLVAGGWGDIGGGFVTIKSTVELYERVAGLQAC